LSYIRSHERVGPRRGRLHRHDVPLVPEVSIAAWTSRESARGREPRKSWSSGSFRAREQVKPNIQKDRGLKAVYWLVDREAGKGLIVTLWESQEAMAASERARALRQAGTSAATGASVTTERYEVVDAFLP